jgi:hypothetical protein
MEAELDPTGIAAIGPPQGTPVVWDALEPDPWLELRANAFVPLNLPSTVNVLRMSHGVCVWAKCLQAWP